MLAIIGMLAIIFFGAGIVLKIVGITVGMVVGSAFAIILFILAVLTYLLTRDY